MAEKEKNLKDLQEQLVREASSLVNEVAINVVNQMRKHGWLTGDNGLLKGAYLENANLAGADLYHVNLAGADLRNAHLAGADLGWANLAGVDLGFTDLEKANLGWANLAGANLEDTNLAEVDLQFANLQRTRLENTEFNENTILPDKSKWTPDTDMSRFADSKHPDFWRSDNPNSPAYRGEAKV